MRIIFSGSQRGFTLIEVIAVLVIIGIIAAVAISRATSTAQATLKSDAEKLKVHLRYAQLRALNSTERAWGVDFSGSTNSYRLYYADTSAYYVSFPGEETTVTLPNTTIAIDGDTGRRVSFDAWGKPYQSLQANFASPSNPQTADRTITLSAGGYSETITITKNTGYIP